MLALISGFLDKSTWTDFQEPKSLSLKVTQHTTMTKVTIFCWCNFQNLVTGFFCWNFFWYFSVRWPYLNKVTNIFGRQHPSLKLMLSTEPFCDHNGISWAFLETTWPDNKWQKLWKIYPIFNSQVKSASEII